MWPWKEKPYIPDIITVKNHEKEVAEKEKQDDFIREKIIELSKTLYFTDGGLLKTVNGWGFNKKINEINSIMKNDIRVGIKKTFVETDDYHRYVQYFRYKKRPQLEDLTVKIHLKFKDGVDKKLICKVREDVFSEVVNNMGWSLLTATYNLDFKPLIDFKEYASTWWAEDIDGGKHRIESSEVVYVKWEILEECG